MAQSFFCGFIIKTAIKYIYDNTEVSPVQSAI